MAKQTYLMESEQEANRLEAKTDHELVTSQLRMTGLARGARALDVGAGTGAVARDMAQLVGPTGSVTALDLSASRLREGASLADAVDIKNIEFIQGDVLEHSLPSASFDYVWARFLLEYLDDPANAARQMVNLVKPGGRVVASDVDGHGLFHFPADEAFMRDLDSFMGALRGRFDPFMGRKLHHLFATMDEVGDVQVDVRPYHLVVGTITQNQLVNWQRKLDTLSPIGVNIFGSVGYKKFRSHFEQQLLNPTTLMYSVLFTVWATRRRG